MAKTIIENIVKTEKLINTAVCQIFFSVLQGAQNVGLTAPHLEAIACARASAGAIFAVLDRKPAIDSMSKEGSKPVLEGDMELKDVYFRYPARPDVQVTCVQRNNYIIKIPFRIP